MSTNMTERELLERIARLPRRVRPDNDPWPGIAARLDAADGIAAPVAAPPAWSLRAAAALAVVAVALAVVFSAPDRSPRPAAEGLAAAPPIIAASEAEYLAAFREFIPLGDARDALPVPAVESIENVWAAMRQAEQALQAALDEHPGNPFLNRRMLELRARQLGFLRQLAVLDHSNRRLST